ncbi:MAG: hypothetical protein OHK0017_11770 [Patescibacteria group bacterium]
MTLSQLQALAIEIKQKYNELNAQDGHKPWTLAEYTQGFVGDVGDLMKLVMAKNGYRRGQDVDEKLKHELADCLWSILLIAEVSGIDLEQEFVKNMDQLKLRIEAQKQNPTL